MLAGMLVLMGIPPALAMGYAAVIASARTVLEIGNEAEVNTGYVWVTAENMDDADIKPLVYK